MYEHACIAQVFLYMHIGNNNIYILINHYSHPTASPLTDCIAKLSCTLRIFIITFRFTSDLKKKKTEKKLHAGLPKNKKIVKFSKRREDYHIDKNISTNKPFVTAKKFIF